MPWQPMDPAATTRAGASRFQAAAIVNAVHINANGTLDGTWSPNPNGTVSAIAVSGSNVYLGGTFSTVGGTARNNAAAVDPNSGADTGWNPNLNGTVNAIAVGSLCRLSRRNVQHREWRYVA